MFPSGNLIGLVHTTCIGIEVPVGPQQELAICKAMVLCLTVDLPAKAKVLAVTQFNGEYGCTNCKHQGEVVPVGRGHTRVYSYQRTRTAPLRTHSECFKLGRQALKEQQVSSTMHEQVTKFTTN